jgi:hypothetical protein
MTTAQDLRSRLAATASQLPNSPKEVVDQVAARVDRVIGAIAPSSMKGALRDGAAAIADAANAVVTRSNDLRVEWNGRFSPQVLAVRARATEAIESAAATRAAVEHRIDPAVDRVLERLPEQVAETVVELRKVRRDLSNDVDARARAAVMAWTALPERAEAPESAAPKTRKAGTRRSAARPTTARAAKAGAAKKAKASARTRRTARPAARTRVASA